MQPLNFDFVTLTADDLANKGAALQGKLKKALQDGIFYVQVDQACQQGLKAAEVFASHIRSREEELMKFNTEPYMGYQPRTGTQAVAFVAKQVQWNEAFAKQLEIEKSASTLHQLALSILKKVLETFSVKKELWDKATGGLTDGKGMIIFTLNHYQPGGPEKVGLPPHTDIGWITLLHTPQAGLKAFINGRETSVPKREGYVVGNFGKALEILLKIPASIHYVEKVFHERVSGGLFINHQEGTDMCELQPDGSLVVKQTYQQYLESRQQEFRELEQKALRDQSA